jgi:hypothetical protein
MFNGCLFIIGNGLYVSFKHLETCKGSWKTCLRRVSHCKVVGTVGTPTIYIAWPNGGGQLLDGRWLQWCKVSSSGYPGISLVRQLLWLYRYHPMRRPRGVESQYTAKYLCFCMYLRYDSKKWYVQIRVFKARELEWLNVLRKRLHLMRK